MEKVAKSSTNRLIRLNWPLTLRQTTQLCHAFRTYVPCHTQVWYMYGISIRGGIFLLTEDCKDIR
jgi:hypothetical protein